MGVDLTPPAVCPTTPRVWSYRKTRWHQVRGCHRVGTQLVSNGKFYGERHNKRCNSCHKYTLSLEASSCIINPSGPRKGRRNWQYCSLSTCPTRTIRSLDSSDRIKHSQESGLTIIHWLERCPTYQLPSYSRSKLRL